jgi:hypothetical protein
MASRLASLAVAALAASVSAIPTPQSSGSSLEPCGQVAALVANDIEENGRAASVPADVAYACLKSVPNYSDPAVKLIESIQAFVQWQSTLAWLKDPPKSYGFPAIDVVSRLDDIKQNAQDGKYDSEYDFQVEIYKVFRLAHDGHFNYQGDALGRFIFYNDLVGDVVSVSPDGKSVPKLYHWSDLEGASSNGTDAVAISKINGKDAVDFYIDIGRDNSIMQDADSQWNGQFPIYAADSRSSVFGQSLLYLVEEIEIEYEDGSTRSQTTVGAFSAAADPGTDWDGITSGEDFYDRFCNPSTTTTNGKKMKRDERPAVETPVLRKRQSSSSDALPNYPEPIVRDDGYDVLSGYFLNGTGYNDVAVLAISSFLPASDSSDTTAFVSDFQSVVETFLAESKKQGKKKLVIDLTNNGGGAIVAATDLFVQLFPDKERFSANNLRRSESFVDIANAMQDTIEKSGWQPSTNQEQQAAALLAGGTLGSSINPFTGIYEVEGDQYATIADVIEEVDLKGDKFTEYQRSLFNNPDPTYNLTGVGSRSDPPAAVFAAEDIVVLTDGTCGSSCTILSYFLIYDVGVQFITAGGRPQTGKIQSLGGVEGSETYTWDTIAQAAIAALILADDSDLEDKEIGTIAEAYAYARAGSPPQINAKNAFAPFDSETPLQFLNQYANCRIWYTADMVLDPVATWKKTVDAAWTDPDGECVKDSRTPIGAVYSGEDDLDDGFDADSAASTVPRVAVGVVVGVVAAIALAL